MKERSGVHDRPSTDHEWTTGRWILGSGILVALGTAALYCISSAYYRGFLSGLRLDPEVLDRNFHQVLYSGFVVALGPAIACMVLYAAAVTGYALVLPDLRFKRFKLKRKFARFRKKTRAASGHRKAAGRATRDSEKRARRRACSALKALALVLAGFVGLVAFERRGFDEAQERLKQAEDAGSAEKLIVRIDGKLRELRYFACGARNCAAIEPVTGHVYYFPQTGHIYQSPFVSRAAESP